MGMILRESIHEVADRARRRASWWAEPAADDDSVFLVRSEDGVVAEGLSRRQAMTIASEYNRARADAESLARRLDVRRKSA